ncbi:MAG: zinc ABC transporter substrate-binding protein [Victivallales bacterium]|nr:zinc ABC transporter substrate-binding protein [Victivallales bacterium]
MKLFLLTLLACIVCHGAGKIMVITGITAQNEAVREIGGNLVTVESLLPQTASPEIFSPNAKQLAIFDKAELFLSIDTPMERAVLPKIKASFPKLRICDTTEGMYFRAIEGDSHEKHGGHDPHVWLGIANMKIHAQNVAKALCSAMPKNTNKIQSNLKTYLGKLDMLEKEINNILLPIQGETVLVFHPAFGYLLDTANILQLAVEQHGKEASAKHLAQISQAVKTLKCTLMFVQPQSNPVSAAKAASILHRKIIVLNPIPVNYSSDMLELAKTIRSAFPQ